MFLSQKISQLSNKVHNSLRVYDNQIHTASQILCVTLRKLHKCCTSPELSFTNAEETGVHLFWFNVNAALQYATHWRVFLNCSHTTLIQFFFYHLKHHEMWMSIICQRLFCFIYQVIVSIKSNRPQKLVKHLVISSLSKLSDGAAQKPHYFPV